MLKFKLTLAFDGAAYQGWQAQRGGGAVQDRVHEALAGLFASKPRVTGSSRTDAGVHARGLVAHFEVAATECPMTPDRLRLALNALLPPDIRVMAAARVAASFHARFQAVSKQYRYTVWNHPVMDPLLRTQAWHVPQPLDEVRVRRAAGHLVGRHDFRAFTSRRGGTLEDAARTVFRCDLRRQGARWTFIIEGDGFLYKMCRGIVGTLVQIGQGKLAADALPGILAGGDRRDAGMNAPAHGLVLWQVRY